MTIVSRELGRIAQTINRGVAGIGLSRLAGERSKRESAELDYRLSRNRAYDERAGERWDLEKPGLEAAAGIAEAVKQKGFAPASWNAEMPDAYSAAHFSKYIAPGIAKIYDAKWEQDERGFSRLKKKDGSYVTNFDREANKQDEVGLFHSKYKIRSMFKDQLARWQEKKDRITEMGIPMAQMNKETQRLNANIAEATRIMNDPNAMIKRLEDQKEGLRQMGNYPEEIKRIDGEIRYERSKLMTPAQKLAEKRSEALHKETMALRKVQLETARKNRKLAKKTGIKLHPSQEAKKQALLKRYGNNLAIQKQYKAGYDEFLGVQTSFKEKDYTDAVSDNEQIMKDLEGLGVDKGTRESLLNEAIAIAQEMQDTSDSNNTPETETKESSLPPQEASQQERYIKLRQQGKSPEEAHRLSLKSGAGGSF